MSTYTMNSATQNMLDQSRIFFRKPKRDNNKVISLVYYVNPSNNRKENLIYSTGKVQYSLKLINDKEGLIQFERNDDTQDLFAFIEEIEEISKTTVWNESSNWFGKKMDYYDVGKLFRSLITVSKGKQILRIPFIHNNNKTPFLLQNEFGNSIKLNELNNKNSISLEILCDAIHIQKYSFSMNFMINKITHYEKRFGESSFFPDVDGKNISLWEQTCDLNLLATSIEQTSDENYSNPLNNITTQSPIISQQNIDEQATDEQATDEQTPIISEQQEHLKNDEGLFYDRTEKNETQTLETIEPLEEEIKNLTKEYKREKSITSSKSTKTIFIRAGGKKRVMRI